MSIVFATPAYGHTMILACHLSYMALQRDLITAGVPHDFIDTGNESLVTRARNTTVARFRNDPRYQSYERLMFIDADIEFTSDAVGKLWNLDVDVAVGAYPIKTRECPLTSVWIGGNLIDLKDLKGPQPCEYAGTGFMLIKRHVFDKLEEAHPEWIVTGWHTENYNQRYCCFFQGSIPEDGVEWSEDYLLCKRWQELGGEVIVDPSVILQHWGTYRFTGE